MRHRASSYVQPFIYIFIFDMRLDTDGYMTIGNKNNNYVWDF